MARGKKTDAITIYQVMVSYVQTRNYSETARQLNMPQTTVEYLVKENKDKPEFVKLWEEKKDEFIETATRIINKAQKRLEKTIDNEEENIPINHLTTAIGTLYDKRALAKGESTNNTNFEINIKVVE